MEIKSGLPVVLEMSPLLDSVEEEEDAVVVVVILRWVPAWFLVTSTTINQKLESELRITVYLLVEPNCSLVFREQANTLPQPRAKWLNTLLTRS